MRKQDKRQASGQDQLVEDIGEKQAPQYGQQIAENKSYKEIVLEVLRNAIISGKFPAGAKLKQDKIAADFGVSRMPVREALLQLQAEGLIEFPRHRVATVREFSVTDIREIFEIRAMLETRAVELGVPHLTARDLRELESCHQTMSGFSKWVPKWWVLNRRFHSIVYEASGRTYMCRLIGSVQGNLDRYLSVYLNTLDTLARSNAEHAAILEACCAGDGKRAGKLTYRHIWDTAETLIAHIEQKRRG